MKTTGTAIAISMAACIHSAGCTTGSAIAPDGGQVSSADANPTTPPPGTPDASEAPPDGVPDAGGGTVTCTGLEDMSGSSVRTITAGGRERQFRLHVPPSYDPTQPTPLVLNFHGYTSNASQQELYTSMSQKADAEGFIAVHPDGIGASWNAGGYCGTAANTGVDDVGFTRAILDELSTTLCIDSRRVYATGMSNGGFMSHRLACDLSDRIAAVAPVAGHNVTTSCAPTRPVPVMHFHGTSDSTVPYSGTGPTIAAWVERNGCESSPTVTFDSGNATCETYGGCDDGVEVTLCTITGLGHSWPGAFGGSADIAATDAMWPFFERYALP